VLYFGSNDGALYKVAALDGALIWRFNTNSEVARRPVIRNGILYLVNANDTLVALEAATGKLKWTQHRVPAFGMEVAGYAGPALGRDKVYAAFSDGTVQAYSLEDGSEQWPTVDLAAEAEQAAGGDVPRYLDVDTTPVLDRQPSGMVVYVAGYAAGVFALDAENGTRVWANDKPLGVTHLVVWEQPEHPPSSGQGPELPARKLLLGASGLTGLWALDPADGHTVWRRNLPEGGMTAPVPMQGALLVGTTRYGIFLFSPLDGGLIDGLQTGNGFAMTPAAYGRHAFVLSNGGTLVGMSVEPWGVSSTRHRFMY
jgi:outer membrane protein assembly factor BamB